LSCIFTYLSLLHSSLSFDLNVTRHLDSQTLFRYALFLYSFFCFVFLHKSSLAISRPAGCRCKVTWKMYILQQE
ncbi:hypothetical protein KSS87_010749, partial [Heliosperma pusillum]